MLDAKRNINATNMAEFIMLDNSDEYEGDRVACSVIEQGDQGCFVVLNLASCITWALYIHGFDIHMERTSCES